MRIVLITQNEPFFLARNIRYLLEHIGREIKIEGCVLLSPSPFGRNKSFSKKIVETYKIFGFLFVLYYGYNYFLHLLFSNRKVKNVLKEFSIPIIQLDKSINSKESLEKIRRYNPDLLISILGNEIFKKQLINLAPKGCLNLHTALLPKYRGVMPTFWVLKNNEKETGVSVFFVDEGIDSGPIIVQKRIEIPKSCTQRELIKLTKHIGMEAIIEAIHLIQSNKYDLIENNDKEASYFKMPSKSDIEEFKKNGKKLI